MNQVRITITVQEMDDQEAIDLKKALEKLVEPKPGALVTMTLRPARAPGGMWG